ncbi:MAG: TonB-dependent receptor [Methylophaga sp.]
MHFKHSLTSFLVLSALTSSALADDNSSLELDHLLVTASRIDAATKPAANVTVLDADDIQSSPAKSLAELLGYQAGIQTRSLFGHGSRPTVDMRGFGTTATQNTLILLDGRRLNDVDLSSVNFSAIPLDNIKQIEIIRGAGSVLYGDGASGGVVNIITRDPRGVENFATLSTTFGSEDHLTAEALASYRDENFGISANISSTSDDGYRDNNEFDQETGQFDLRVPFANTEFYWKLGGYDQEIELPGERSVNPTIGLNELKQDRKGTGSPNDYAEEQAEYTTIGLTTQLNQNDLLVLDAGYRNKEQRSQFDYGFGYGAYTDTRIETLSFTPRLELNRVVFSKPLNIKLGADFYHYDYKSDRSNFKANVNQPIHQLDIDQKSHAGYLLATMQATDTTLVTAGWRVQRVEQEARDDFNPSAPGSSIFDSEAADFDRTDSEESYELGIEQALTESLSVYARHDRSARFGTVDELFEFNSMFQQVFSPLKPQTSKNYELGLQFDNQRWQGGVAIFQQDVENEIHFDPVSFQNVNLDDTEHKGLEAKASYWFSEVLTLSAAYTYLDAEFTDGDNDGSQLPLIPQHSYMLSASGKVKDWFKYAVVWNHVSASHFENDESNDFGEKIPSYQTVDFKLSRSFADLDLALRINNVFDEEYYTYGVSSASTPGAYNAYPLPERTVYFSASYTFR